MKPRLHQDGSITFKDEKGLIAELTGKGYLKQDENDPNRYVAVDNKKSEILTAF